MRDAKDIKNNRETSLVFIDADDMPGAIILSCAYTIEGKNIIVTLNFIKDGQKIYSEKIIGSVAKIDGLIVNIIDVMNKKIEVK